jgi:hypothetical protein
VFVFGAHDHGQVEGLIVDDEFGGLAAGAFVVF